MLDKLFDGFLENGILGMAVIGMALYIMFLHKTYVKVHSKSQEEWKEIAKEGHSIMKELQKEGHALIRENTSVLSALKTILETTREKIK